MRQTAEQKHEFSIQISRCPAYWWNVARAPDNSTLWINRKKSGEPRGNRTKYAREGHRSETKAENEKMEHTTGENERRLKDLSKG